jgi:pyruvate formate lyase activating enzyme
MVATTNAPLAPASPDALQRTGSVHSWDLSTGVDGPGTRFTLFVAGCPLRCLYCQNPDTWRVGQGQQTSVQDVVRQISRYTDVFGRTGGGVTISGGEPLLQPAFVASVLHECRRRGIHTAIDTSGALGAQAGDAMLADTNLVLLDIKAFDQRAYEKVTQGGSLAPTLRFAARLEALRVPVWVRYVVVPGLNDDPDGVARLATIVSGLANVERVDVIGFHHLGESKYAALGVPFPLGGQPSPTAAELDAVRQTFARHGLVVT